MGEITNLEATRHKQNRDQRRKDLAADFTLDELTRFHSHKGFTAFNRDWTSVTEDAALWRIEQCKSTSEFVNRT